MKSILKTLLVAAVLSSAVPAALSAQASSAEPFVVLRFTGPYLDYQGSLSRAVKSAVGAKKNVVFDVVAGRQVAMYGNQVARDIIAMGVHPTNVNLRASGINNNEVLIFVR